jgi:hypothetical protein
MWQEGGPGLGNTVVVEMGTVELYSQRLPGMTDRRNDTGGFAVR